jgi:hypothetical protein
METEVDKRRNKTKTIRITVVFGLLLFFQCIPSHHHQPAPEKRQERIVAVADVHGNYDALVGILQKTGLINENHHWVGANTIWVQTGDLFDRGPHTCKVLDLIMALQTEAPLVGGRVVVLLGNHEVMNMTGDYRYVSPEAMAPFVDSQSELRRAQAFEQWKKKQGLPDLEEEKKKKWMDANPLGLLEYSRAFRADGKYGRWLRHQPVVAKIGDTLFLHGGISPALKDQSINDLNRKGSEELAVFDRGFHELVKRKMILPSAERTQISVALKIDTGSTGLEPSAGLWIEPIASKQDPITDLIHILSQGILFHEEGLVWFRGFATWPEKRLSTYLPSLLKHLGAKRVVVGHSVRQDGVIEVRLNKSVFLLDTGMLSSVYAGGQASALEIDSGRITAIYLSGEDVLLESPPVCRLQ